MAESATKNCKKLVIKCIRGGKIRAFPLEFRNCPRVDGFFPAPLMFIRGMKMVLLAAVEAIAPVPLNLFSEVGLKNHAYLLSQFGNLCLEDFMKGMTCCSRITLLALGNCVPTCWVSDGEVYHTCSSSRTQKEFIVKKWFLLLKKKIFEEPKNDEQRRILYNPSLADTSFDPTPPRHSKQRL